MYGANIDDLVGKKVLRIFMNEDHLQFITDQGAITFSVEGDCCSTSVFYDFYGVKKLLENGPIKRVEDVELHPTDITKDEQRGTMKDRKDSDEDIEVYGYSITTEHPEWGEMTSVFSFRNYSNGYYGGSLERAAAELDVQPEIFDDVIETAPSPSR